MTPSAADSALYSSYGIWLWPWTRSLLFWLGIIVIAANLSITSSGGFDAFPATADCLSPRIYVSTLGLLFFTVSITMFLGRRSQAKTVWFCGALFYAGLLICELLVMLGTGQ